MSKCGPLTASVFRLGRRLGVGPGTLFVVATPIGNLQDISRRAAKVLLGVPVIAAESVHTAEALLRTIGRSSAGESYAARRETSAPPGFQELAHREGSDHPASAPCRIVSYHSHNEQERVPELLSALHAGTDVALISRVGTPGWRDPGQILVGAAHQQGLNVTGVPGPSSVAAALSVSGLCGDRLFFEGYLPTLRELRLQRLAQLRSLAQGNAVGGMTLAVFADGASLDDVLLDIADVLGNNLNACVAKEISMPHERIITARIQALRTSWTSLHVEARRGAVVLLVDLSDMSASEHQSTLNLSKTSSTQGVGLKQEVDRVVSVLLRGGLAPQKVASLTMNLTGSSMPIAQHAVHQASLNSRSSAFNRADAVPLEGADASRPSHARRTLHIVNLGPHVTAEELASALAQAGAPSGNLSVAENHVGEKIAFVRFASEEKASEARTSINVAGIMLGARRPLLAGWARRERWIM